MKSIQARSKPYSMHLKLYSDDEDDDRGCYPMASTPKKGENILKHTLTPESKRQTEPVPKRFHASALFPGTCLLNTVKT